MRSPSLKRLGYFFFLNIRFNDMNYQILDEQIIYNGFLKIKKARIRHDTFEGNQTLEITRESMERGDSVAIVIFEKDTNSFLFSKQFRYPTIETSSGWIIELIAGVLEENEKPESCAEREIHEEIGYKVDQLKFISNFYVSPGGTSERIFLYYAEVNSSDQVQAAGGIDSENIQLIRIEKDVVKKLIQENQINDAKTLVGLQYYFLQYVS
jgi:ADP-ribose pyrophosphatase